MLALYQDASSQFCPQKVCRTSGGSLPRPRRADAGVRTQRQSTGRWHAARAGQALDAAVQKMAGPATLTSRRLNPNGIKYLSQHKRACTHSFPQKVCKDEAADKLRLPKSGTRPAARGFAVNKSGCPNLRQQGHIVLNQRLEHIGMPLLTILSTKYVGNMRHTELVCRNVDMPHFSSSA